MSIIDTFLAYIAPHDCVGCDREGSLLCTVCLGRLQAPVPRCYRCRRRTAEWQTCTHCRSGSALYAVRVAGVYEGSLKQLVWRLKFAGAQAAALPAALLMREVATSIQRPALLVPVPTATSRIRQRGYDQAQLLARQLARMTNLSYHSSLVRSGQAHQVGASRQVRLRQLSQAFRVSRPSSLVGKHVILVDDVITTGATLEAAARACREAGAWRVEAIIVAQA